jgi:hypothetical protein
MLKADVQTGPRPVSRQAYKSGGGVMGAKSAPSAGRAPRKAAGGSLTATSYQNRDLKVANEAREGEKHVGGMKKGGRAGKMGGGSMCAPAPTLGAGGRPMPVRPMMRAKGGKTEKRDWLANSPLKPHEMAALHAENQENIKKGYAPYPTVQPNQRPRDGMSKFKAGGKVHEDAAEDKKLIKSEMHKAGCGCAKCHGGKVAKKRGGSLALDGSYQGTRPTGGRLARASGGKTKGKMNVNIIIAPPRDKPAMPMPMAPPPGGGIPAPPPPAAAAGPMPGAPSPMGAAPMPMGRKYGGKASYPIKNGAGGGMGRLEKAGLA